MRLLFSTSVVFAVCATLGQATAADMNNPYGYGQQSGYGQNGAGGNGYYGQGGSQNMGMRGTRSGDCAQVNDSGVLFGAFKRKRRNNNFSLNCLDNYGAGGPNGRARYGAGYGNSGYGNSAGAAYGNGVGAHGSNHANHHNGGNGMRGHGHNNGHVNTHANSMHGANGAGYGGAGNNGAHGAGHGGYTGMMSNGSSGGYVSGNGLGAGVSVGVSSGSATVSTSSSSSSSSSASGGYGGFGGIGVSGNASVGVSVSGGSSVSGSGGYGVNGSGSYGVDGSGGYGGDGYGSGSGSFGAGWYLRGDLGFASLDLTKVEKQVSYIDSVSGDVVYDGGSFYSSELDASWTISAGLGYQVSNSFRVDAILSHIGEVDFKGDSSTAGSGYACNLIDGQADDDGDTCTSVDSATFSATLGMANAYIDLGNFAGFTPYIGGGLGGAYVHWSDMKNDTRCDATGSNCTSTAGLSYENEFDGVHGNKSGWRFAYAAHAGASYQITNSMKFDAGYSFTNISGGDMFGFAVGEGVQGRHGDIQVHEVKAGIRYSFN